MRILQIENNDHCCFLYSKTQFSILGVSANSLYDCYSGIADIWLISGVIATADVMSRLLLDFALI